MSPIIRFHHSAIHSSGAEEARGGPALAGHALTKMPSGGGALHPRAREVGFLLLLAGTGAESEGGIVRGYGGLERQLKTEAMMREVRRTNIGWIRNKMR